MLLNVSLFFLVLIFSGASAKASRAANMVFKKSVFFPARYQNSSLEKVWLNLRNTEVKHSNKLIFLIVFYKKALGLIST